MPSWAPDWRVLDRNAILDYYHQMETATKLAPKVSSESSYPEMVGIEGVHLDFIEETFLLGSHEALDGWQSKILLEITRILKFNDTFTKKMMGQGYPTGEDSNIAFARRLLLDDKILETQVHLGRSLSREAILRRWNAWYKCLMDSGALDVPSANYPSAALEEAIEDFPYTEALRSISEKQAYMITKSGYIGLGPLRAAAGDVVTVFNGASTPFVLRKVLNEESIQVRQPAVGMEDIGKWEIVGASYIQGCMDNEITSPEWQAKKEMFWIE